jgi:5-formyltetrahydrofolate cyclo-ligase
MRRRLCGPLVIMLLIRSSGVFQDVFFVVVRAGFPNVLRMRNAGPAEEKRRLRKAVLSTRDNLTGQTRRSAALLAAHHLDQWLCGRRRGLPVGAFVDFGSEINMKPLFVVLQRAGMQVGLPVVRQKGEPLLFRRLRPFQRLIPGAFGILAPGPECPEIHPELFLVPFAAFDGRGYRIGYGGGFYDRTLQRARMRKDRHVIAIGYGFAAQEIPEAPREEHDLPMDGIVTEHGLCWFPDHGIGPCRREMLQ